jgi:hypothetical protein
LDAKTCVFDEGQCAILGVIPKSFIPTQESIQRFFETDDWARLMRVFDAASATEHFSKPKLRFVDQMVSGAGAF